MDTGFAVQGNWKAALLLVPAILAFSARPASAKRLEKHFKVDARPVVTIHNPNGTVTVKAWTRSEVLVIADLAGGQAEVGAEQNGNRVDVMTRPLSDNVSPDDLRTDYQINVPQDAELQIHNDSGGVSVANVLGDMTVETVAAGVDFEDVAGYLTVKTVGGSFACLRCAGRVEVNSISGNFRLVDMRSKHILARTSTGNILFSGEFFPDGEYRMRNYSGVIELRFAPGDSFDLSATSIKGKVNNQAKLIPPSHSVRSSPREGNALFGTYNAAGHARVELTSFDGTINIVKRD
jgi:DUF4097 and DUF4098 domain-containing protein YvlB